MDSNYFLIWLLINIATTGLLILVLYLSLLHFTFDIRIRYVLAFGAYRLLILVGISWIFFVYQRFNIGFLL